MVQPKKLIEVALPIDTINREAGQEKLIHTAHPSSLHIWWARRPLAACRAAIFASIVDDPSSRPDLFPTPEAQDAERQRLFRVLERMLPWANLSDVHAMEAARDEVHNTAGDPL